MTWQMQVNFKELNYSGPHPNLYRMNKKKFIVSVCLRPPENVNFHVVRGLQRKMYQKGGCTCKIVISLFKLIDFFNVLLWLMMTPKRRPFT